MSTIEERTAYAKNPFFTGHIDESFTPFYITIAICTVLGIFLILLNIILGCCSKHKNYWQDPYTGNRYICSLWTSTPHNQPPLDLSELKDVKSFAPPSLDVEVEPSEYQVTYHKPQKSGFGRPQRFQREEFSLEFQKRESDI